MYLFAGPPGTQGYPGKNIHQLSLPLFQQNPTVALAAIITLSGEPGQPGLPGSPGDSGFGKQTVR